MSVLSSLTKSINNIITDITSPSKKSRKSNKSLLYEVMSSPTAKTYDRYGKKCRRGYVKSTTNGVTFCRPRSHFKRRRCRRGTKRNRETGRCNSF